MLCGAGSDEDLVRHDFDSRRDAVVWIESRPILREALHSHVHGPSANTLNGHMVCLWLDHSATRLPNKWLYLWPTRSLMYHRPTHFSRSYAKDLSAIAQYYIAHIPHMRDAE